MYFWFVKLTKWTKRYTQYFADTIPTWLKISTDKVVDYLLEFSSFRLILLISNVIFMNAIFFNDEVNFSQIILYTNYNYTHD